MFGWWMVAAASVVACDDGGGGDTEGSEDDAAAVDSGPGGSMVADVAPAPDAGPDLEVGPVLVDAAPPPPDVAPPEPDAAPPRPYPAPGDGPQNAGPGGPDRAFAAEELYVNCATLDGGEQDLTDHHNLVAMFDGYLAMPWAPEWGGGGLTFFDIRDPCAPSIAGTGYSEAMRETHSIGFAELAGRWWAVTAQLRLFDVQGGAMLWDVTDTTAPMPAAEIPLEGHLYPDAYARVTLSTFFQAPYIYVAGADNGVYVIDVRDPDAPEVVNQYRFEPTLRAGQVIAIGTLLFVSAAEGPRTALLDISDPVNPQPIPGGDFDVLAEGEPREAYFSNFVGGYGWYARKEGGGGVMVYDLRDPTDPRPAGGLRTDGNGGYVFVKEGLAFTGESRFAGIYDVSNLDDIREVARLNLEGDLDTATPIGNVVVLSVDDDAAPNEGSAVAPYAMQPDTRPPEVGFVWPADGATDVAPTARVGVSFGEFVDPKTAWAGSVRLYEAGTDPATTRVDGDISVQDTIVNFAPRPPLKSGTTYTLELPAGGVADHNGNRIVETFRMSFSTLGP